MIIIFLDNGHTLLYVCIENVELVNFHDMVDSECEWNIWIVSHSLVDLFLILSINTMKSVRFFYTVNLEMLLENPSAQTLTMENV